MRLKRVAFTFAYLLAWQTFATGLNSYSYHRKDWDDCFVKPSEMSGGMISACTRFTPDLLSDEIISFIPLAWPYILYKTKYFKYGFQYSDDDSDLDTGPKKNTDDVHSRALGYVEEL